MLVLTAFTAIQRFVHVYRAGRRARRAPARPAPRVAERRADRPDRPLRCAPGGRAPGRRRPRRGRRHPSGRVAARVPEPCRGRSAGSSTYLAYRGAARAAQVVPRTGRRPRSRGVVGRVGACRPARRAGAMAGAPPAAGRPRRRRPRAPSTSVFDVVRALLARDLPAARRRAARRRSTPNFTIDGLRAHRGRARDGQGRDPRACRTSAAGSGRRRGWRSAGHHMLAVVETIEPPELLEWFAAPARGDRASRSCRSAPTCRRTVLRALRDNRIVCLLCDRDLTGDGVEVEFFGERTTLPGRPGDARAAHRRGAAAGRGLLRPGRGSPRSRAAAARRSHACGSPARRHRPHHPGARPRVRDPDPRARPSSGTSCSRTGRATANREAWRAMKPCGVKVAMISPVLDVAPRRRAGPGARARARAAQARRRRADRRARATDRHPSPAIVSVGPSVEWESNGSIAPISPGRATARRTAEALRSIEPDVVHLHEPTVPGPCLSALIGFNGPMVGTFHASGELAAHVARPALRSVDDAARRSRVVGVGVGARDRRGATGASAEYVVLWNGIEIERVRDRRRRRRSTRPAVLFIGRHEPRKGLARAARRVGRHRPRRRCSGSAASGRRPTSCAPRRRRANVEWLGTVTDAERNARLRGATVFCAPSLHGESFGVVLLEAMAAGTPIVASAIEGYAERRPRRIATRCSCPPATSTRCADALRRVLDDAGAARPARRVRAATRAEEFSMPRLAERYLELYERAIGARCRERDGDRSATSRELAVDLAARVRDAVAPSLGRSRRARPASGSRPAATSRWRSTRSPSTSAERCCAEAGDIAFYSEDRGYVEIGRPRAILVVDPIDGTRPAAAGLESCCVSVAVVPPSRDATLGDVQFGVVHEIKHGHRFVATPARRAVVGGDGTPVPIRLSANIDLRRAVLDRGLARSSRAADDGRCSRSSSTARRCTAATSISARRRST